ncbi:Alpha/beta knot methyltransferase [Scenedesmus sp. NREL 46B-D3]|nr:Alpha/beta knot methyltransferase [Scenedesmus sp. NREL 46B-D3]
MSESPGSTAEQQQREAQSEPSTSGQQHPHCYVIVYNVSKKHNVGTLLRSCTAFGVKEVCLVGSRHFNAFGSHGADAHVQLRHFPTIDSCCTYLKDTAGCRILGVEIDAAAQPVQGHPFSGNTAFMLGNEGQGLSEKQMRLCDGFVYIPQHGQGTASLNVTVAASIILHHFAVWAAYPERQREGAKFTVDPNLSAPL